MTLEDGSYLNVKKLKLIPAMGRKVAKLVAKDIEWNKDGKIRVSNSY